MVIDTHVHCVPFDIQQELARDGLAVIFRRFSGKGMEEAVESLLMDMSRAGVEISLVVSSGDFDIFEQFSESHPGKLYVAYLYDSRNPREALRSLRKAVEKHPKLIKCVKTVFPYLGQHPVQKEILPLYRFCEEEKLPIQFHMGGDQRMEELSNLMYFAKLCSLFPKLKLVLLHAGGGQVGALPLFCSLWENVFIELEGLQLMEAEGSGEPGVLRYLLDKVDNGRLMFGSDRILPEQKYFSRVQAVRSINNGHAENVCWKNADKLYKLGLKRRVRQKN